MFKKVLILAFCILGSNTMVIAKMQLEPWSEGVFQQIAKDYGFEASLRMRDIYQLIIENQDITTSEKLILVNHKFNTLPRIADRAQWNAEDYWATPLETISRFGGDCEDMAIGKYMTLMLLGIPEQDLYLGYVKIKKTNQAHMVLVWMNNERTESKVLDNLIKEVRSGNERTDLLAVYLLSADGEEIILKDYGNARTIAAEIRPEHIQKLDSLKTRIFDHLAEYKKYNFERPLISFE